MNKTHQYKLKVRDLGIDSYRENIIFMKAECPVCVSEGFTALTRLIVHKNGESIIATLNVVTSSIISNDEAGLSIEAMKRLKLKDGDIIMISHLHPIESLSYVRGKMYGKELNQIAMTAIIGDVIAGRYSNIELAAFVSACAGDKMTVNEMIGLTHAMIDSGQKIKWQHEVVMDKHCVGGLPGNRTTPIVVSIAAAAGLIIPKTSSRAITSPAGTADTMECLTTVNLSIEQIKTLVNQEGACLAWGGGVNLSPADDLLITVEKALDIDSEGQMIASVLSKKVAAGSTHVVIDIPVGPTAKVRTHENALKLQYYFKAVGESVGIQTEIIITDGTQPVGRGIGPALEAMDVLAVLRNESDAPKDLEDRALDLSALMLKMSGQFSPGAERTIAQNLLKNGQAYKKFMSICKAQGGFTEPIKATYGYDVNAEVSGVVQCIDNRKLSRLAKLAGAPASKSSGVWFNAPLGKKISVGDLLLTIYAESEGELAYAKEYLESTNGIIEIK